MNGQFEVLSFEAGMEMEMEEERGGRAGGSRMPRGKTSPYRKAPSRAKPKYRPGPRPRPGRPYYGPVYGSGGWPYGVVVREPFAEPYQPTAPEPTAEPEPEPEPEPQDGGFDDGDGEGQEEVPPTIAGTVGRLPAAMRPTYQLVGSVPDALRDSRATGAGFYLIEFDSEGRRRAYSGQTGDLRRRLQQHALCGRIMGMDLNRHSAYVAPSSLAEPQRRAVEWRIHDDMFRTQRGVLTNQRREMEAETFGETIMHATQCSCANCRQTGEFEVLEFQQEQGEGEFNEAEEMELAMELLSVGSEAELEQFLGKMFKGIWKGVKKIAKPLGGVLKGIAKKALPFVGGALGSMIPIPGVGTALGSALGSAVSKALEMEMEGMEFEQQEFEMARRFVRIAGTAARNAGDSNGSPEAVRHAVLQALRQHVPHFGQ